MSLDTSDISVARAPSAWPGFTGLVIFVLTGVVGISVDLYTKFLAESRLGRGDSFDFIPGYLRFEFIENKGAVFGLAQGQRVVFLIVSAGAIVFLSYLFSTSGRRWFYQFVLGLLLGGVVGNMYDRVRFGSVRDMIHALPGWHWPGWVVHVAPVPAEVFPWIFNVADSLLCTGVGLMLVYSFMSGAKGNAGSAAQVRPLHGDS